MDKTNDHIFIRMQLIEKIKLEPAFISSSYRNEVLKRLKAKVEGICTKHGYIRTDSVEIHKVCSGRVELIGLNGSTVFDVYFWADVCNPLLGSVLKCRVSNINKFGILVEAGNIIEAIVAKNSVSIQSDVDLEKVRIGDDVMVEVVGKKYELNDKKISLIARIVKNKEEIKTYSMKKSAYEADDNEDDEDIRLIDGGDVGSDADNEDEEDNEEDEDDEIDDELDEEDDVEDLEEDVVSEKEDGNFFSDEDDDYFKTDDDFDNDIETENESIGDESD
jgi:DNA-directed RNA polymerase subunit E'/Rpb7